jgi:lipopolysaccharide export system permease protein
VEIFERSPRGVLMYRLFAKRAVFDGTGWRLFGVQRLSIADGQDRRPEMIAEMQWPASITPGHLVDLSTDPATLSVSDVYRFVARPDVGARPVDLYETWMLRKISIPLVALMMVLLAAPVAQGLQRHGGLGIGLAVGVALGFLYFVADGLLLTLGEIGTLPPAIAAFSPLVLFVGVGIGALLKIEGY